jgi:hypothetical protein
MGSSCYSIFYGFASVWTFGRMGRSEARVFMRSRGSYAAPNVTNIKKRGRGGGCLAGTRRGRRHRDEVAESEERDAIAVLLLKHPHTTSSCRHSASNSPKEHNLH